MTHKFLSVLAVLLVLYMLAALPTAQARPAGVVTNCSDDSDFSNQLSAGGTISFDCGAAAITLSSTKTITINTSIDGGGTITLSGDNARRLFVVNPGARLELHNLVIESGFSDSGDGGAIRNLDTLVITNSSFLGNNVSNDWSGGAIYSHGHLSIVDSVFRSNGGGSAGAVYVQGISANIYHSSFFQNYTTNTSTMGVGGAISVDDNASIAITLSTFSKNHAHQGGALAACSGCILIVDDSLICGNSADDLGGGAVISSKANFNNVTLSDNSANTGAGIYNALGALTLDNVEFSGNSAHTDGGGIWSSGKVEATGARFSGNVAGIDGGGIFSSGTVTMSNATFSGNKAGTDGGGAIDNFQGSVTLTGATLNGNSAVTGGALDNFFGQMTLTNATLTGNFAEMDGGGLYNDHGAAFLFSVTMGDNRAVRHGGALFHIDQAIDQAIILKNSIVADSLSGANCFSDPSSLTGIISHGFNLSSDASCPFVVPGDWKNAAAHLGPLANNGGPTRTQIAFPPGKAVDGGSGCPATDQRGVTRPQGQACDIGAVEYVTGELSPGIFLPFVHR